MKLDHHSHLHDLVFQASGPDDIIDAFCFVVGYTTGEIKRRQLALVGDSSAAIEYEQYEERLQQIELAWATFQENTPAIRGEHTLGYQQLASNAGWREQQASIIDALNGYGYDSADAKP